MTGGPGPRFFRLEPRLGRRQIDDIVWEIENRRILQYNCYFRLNTDFSTDSQTVIRCGCNVRFMLVLMIVYGNRSLGVENIMRIRREVPGLSPFTKLGTDPSHFPFSDAYASYRTYHETEDIVWSSFNVEASPSTVVGVTAASTICERDWTPDACVRGEMTSCRQQVPAGAGDIRKLAALLVLRRETING